jgi:polysaccharide deacetylase 2 family uncharacterized protein YibQ
MSMASRAVLSRIPRVAWGLIAAQLLLIAALLLSLGHLFAQTTEESLRAGAAMQRVVIDSKTGIITSGNFKPEPLPSGTIPAFDVAPDGTREKADGARKKPESAGGTGTKKKPDSPKPAATPAHKPVTVSGQKSEAAPPAKPAVSAGTTPVARDTKPLPAARSFVLDVAEPLLAPVPRQQASLVMAPAPEVSEQTPQGILPKHSAGKSTPASLYGRPYQWQPAETQKPVVAVLVIGLGLNARGMEAALQLPPEISFSFSPYGEHSPRWVEWARNGGHEAWMDLPAQTEAFPLDDPGPLGIFKPMSIEQVQKNFRKLMLRFTGYVGFVLPASQTVLKEQMLFLPVAKELEARGLLLAVPTSDVAPESLNYLGPLKKNILLADMLADQEIDENFIRSRLSRLEDQARAKRTAFAVVRAHPLALRLLAEWAKTLPAKNIELVPVSALPHLPKAAK